MRYSYQRHKHNYEDWKRKKFSGYRRNLFRNSGDGKIAGVCAGLADHLNLDHWLMRIIFVAMFFILGPIVIFAYIAAVILLAKRPATFRAEKEYDEERGDYRERNIFKHNKPAPLRLRQAREKMGNILKRVEKMEAYVTSSRFDLERAFDDMEKGR